MDDSGFRVRRSTGALTPLDYWFMLYSRRWPILLVTLVAMGFSAYMTTRIQPVYEAKAIFILRQDAYGSADIAGDRTLQALVPLSSKDRTIAYTEILSGRDTRLRLAAQYPKLTDQVLQRAVAFEVGKQGQITIFVRLPDPDLAAKLANTYIEYCRELIQDPMKVDTARSLGRIEDQVSMSDMELREAVSLRTQFLEENNVGSVRTELEGLQRRSLDLEFDLRAEEIRREALKSQIKSLRTTRLQDQVMSLKAELEASDVRVAGLRVLERETAERLRQVTGVAYEFERLNSDVEEASSSKRSLQSVVTNIGIGTLQSREIGLVVETARPPKSPVFPILWKNLLTALIFGLFAGVLYAFALEGIDMMREQRRQRDLLTQRWVKELLERVERVDLA